MTVSRREHKGAAPATTLAGNISSGDTTILLTSGSNWPTGAVGSFYIVIDRGNAGEEKVLCASRSTNTITVTTRGVDDTAASAHTAGVAVEHCLTAIELDQANQHQADTAVDDHCFSEDTEILTEEGWLGIDSVEEELLAWTFNSETEAAELEPIQAVWRYDADKFPSLVSLENQDVGRILVTPDHSMVWRRPPGKWGVRPASTLPKQFAIPARARWAGEGLSTPDHILALVAWAATEGCWQDNGRVLIAQKEGPFADRIRGWLVQAELPFSEYKQRGEMRAFRVHAASLLYFLDEQKVPRRELIGMSERQARLFLGECVLADGSVSGGDKLNRIVSWEKGGVLPACQIASINGYFVDWLQELAVLHGIKTREYNDGYISRLVLKQTADHSIFTRGTEPNYGRVWCVTVGSNATVIARRPGTAPFIAGNTQYLNTTRHDVTARHTFGAALPSPAAPTTSAVGDAAAAGSAAGPARADHTHGREAFATNAVVLGTAAAAGAATTLIRSDATIAAFDATVPTSSAVGDAAAAGSVAKAARRDHTHGREAFAAPTTLATTSTQTTGTATTINHSDHDHGYPAAAPRGTVGYAQVVANQAGIGAGPTDLTSLTVTFTTVAGRRYKITGHVQGLVNTSDSAWAIDVLEGGTTLGRVGVVDVPFTHRGMAAGSIVITPSAAAHTYKLTATRYAGAGTLDIEASATQPAYIHMEDAGT